MFGWGGRREGKTRFVGKAAVLSEPCIPLFPQPLTRGCSAAAPPAAPARVNVCDAQKQLHWASRAARRGLMARVVHKSACLDDWKSLRCMWGGAGRQECGVGVGGRGRGRRQAGWPSLGARPRTTHVLRRCSLVWKEPSAPRGNRDYSRSSRSSGAVAAATSLRTVAARASRRPRGA